VIDQFLDEHRSSSGVTSLIMTVFDAGGVGGAFRASILDPANLPRT